MADQEDNNGNRPFHREGDAVVFDPIPDPKNAAAETRQNEAHKFQRDVADANKKMARFNGWLVLATFCTIGVGIWQGIISQKSANAARDAVKVASDTLTEAQAANVRQDALADQARVASAAAAKLSNEQTSRALQATIDNFHKQQRAWIGVVDYGVSPIEADKPVDFRIVLRNSGRTPALHFKVDAHGWFFSNFNNRSYEQIDKHLRETLPRGDSVIAPEAVHVVRNEYAQEKVSPQEASSFEHGGSTLYITGNIEFTDATQGAQTMTFCIDYSTPGLNVQIPPSPRLCEHGNAMSYEKQK